jgi:rare lipoprotein A
MAPVLLAACSAPGPAAIQAPQGLAEPARGPIGTWSSAETRQSAPVPKAEPTSKPRGYAKIGRPYQVAGRWYTPREDPNYDAVGIASFYAHDFHGKATANGEVFDMMSISAAHKTLPLPSYVMVENLENGRQLKVRVNDRGPFVAGRIIDLSKRSAQLLGFEGQGLAKVRVRYLGPAPLQ